MRNISNTRYISQLGYKFYNDCEKRFARMGKDPRFFHVRLLKSLKREIEETFSPSNRQDTDINFRRVSLHEELEDKFQNIRLSL